MFEELSKIIDVLKSHHCCLWWRSFLIDSCKLWADFGSNKVSSQFLSGKILLKRFKHGSNWYWTDSVGVPALSNDSFYLLDMPLLATYYFFTYLSIFTSHANKMYFCILQPLVIYHFTSSFLQNLWSPEILVECLF